jgi:hypothetical protein
MSGITDLLGSQYPVIQGAMGVLSLFDQIEKSANRLMHCSCSPDKIRGWPGS